MACCRQQPLKNNNSGSCKVSKKLGAIQWAMALQLGKLGIPSILDFGFQRLEHRQRYAGLVKNAQLPARLHVLNVDASERWKRVEARNKNQGETFHMEITRCMFDYIETTWEPPSDGEIASMSTTD